MTEAEAIEQLIRNGVTRVTLWGGRYVGTYSTDPISTSMLLAQIKPYLISTYGTDAKVDLKEALIRLRGASVTAATPSLAGAPPEWVEMLDWEFVAELVRRGDWGWRDRLTAYLRSLRLEAWIEEIIKETQRGAK